MPEGLLGEELISDTLPNKSWVLFCIVQGKFLNAVDGAIWLKFSEINLQSWLACVERTEKALLAYSDVCTELAIDYYVGREMMNC